MKRVLAHSRLFAGHIRCEDSWCALANFERTVATIDGLRQQGHDQMLQPRIHSTGIFFFLSMLLTAFSSRSLPQAWLLCAGLLFPGHPSRQCSWLDRLAVGTASDLLAFAGKC
eukprot:scaffold154623_cov30-Attheya_sp.AAC.1